MSDKLILFPETARIERGHLSIGGRDAAELCREFGTPLYVFDEAMLRTQCRGFIGEFRQRYPDTRVVYACKAFINRALAALLAGEGLGFDVVSGGELSIVLAAGAAPERIYFHGNNKSREELAAALGRGVGRIVADNFHELALLEELAAGRRQKVLLRLTPGIDPHTHKFTTTGIVDSKFGFSLVDGQAEEAVKLAGRSRAVELVGLHFHLGSPIFEMEPYEKAIPVVLDFAAAMKERHGLALQELSIGGGFAVSYVLDRPAPPIAAYAEAIATAVREACRQRRLAGPALVIEPGRSIVGRAGVALYSVGAVKRIPGVRTYVSVDGGMADNIRPALYGAKYEVLVANRAGEEGGEVVSIAGKFCESGDILVQDVRLPALRAGDILALPAAGAYCLSMASNYNSSLKPPVVLVKDGQARLIRRRESYDDLMRCDEV
ncbi:MAG: diaminopimelate decarboxylase [Chloroflexi bacterium]|nr:diaminopimelate decarboxylase [Chloroflexota bacterium]